jgi:hypothetical protein
MNQLIEIGKLDAVGFSAHLPSDRGDSDGGQGA